MKNDLKKEFNIDKLVSKLTSIIKKNKGIVTPVELATKTGNSLDEINLALDRLIELYETRINLNQETGALQYIFQYPLFKRGSKTFKEKLFFIFDKIYKAFQVVYKASVGIILIFYTILFVLILLVFILAASRNDNDDSGSNFSFAPALIRGIIWGIIDGIFWINHPLNPTSIVYQVDPVTGSRYKTYKKEKNKGKGFVRSAFSFVFGPDLPKFDPLADAREVLAYLKLYTKGKLTAANIIELSGADYPKAESKLAEYVGKFQGNLNVTNSGVLYGDFENIVEDSSNKGDHSNIEFYKDEVEPPVEFTGNTAGKNFAVIAMNTFNLAMSAFFLFAAIPPIIYQDTEILLSDYAFLSTFPFIVSVLYFVIPLLRFPAYKARKAKRDYNVWHKKIIGYICSQRKVEFSLQDFIYNLNISSNSQIDKLQNMLSKIVVELEGTIEISENGETIYKFERLYKELIIN